MSMLVTDYDAYKNIVAKYKKLTSNFYYLPAQVNALIREKRLGYIECHNQLLIFLNQGLYNDLFYYSNDIQITPMMLEKPLCITLLDRKNTQISTILEIEHKLIFLGAQKVACNFGVELDLSHYKDNIKELCSNDAAYLSNLGLAIKTGRDNKYISKIQNLWKSYLPYYHVPYDHMNYIEHPNHNVICLVDNNDIVAGTYWFCDTNKIREARHIVVNPLNRRKGLGSILIRYAIYDAISKDIKKCKTWIADNNKNSLLMHEKMGFVKNSIIAYQYLFDVNSTN